MNKLMILVMILGTVSWGWNPLVVVPETSDAWVSLGDMVKADGSGAPAQRTAVAIQRTATALKFRLICAESSMDKLVATVQNRDGVVWNDDCVEIFLQPQGSGVAHFIVNPLGTVYDELNRDASWNSDCQALVTKHDSDWTVDMTIPLAALGVTPRKGDEWRLNVCRSRRSEAELSCWSPTGNSFHVPEKFGVLRFDEVPVITGIDWSFFAKGKGSVAVHCAEPLTHTLSGKPLPADGSFVYSNYETTKLYLESQRQGKPVYRALKVVTVSPVAEQLKHVMEILAAIKPEEAKLCPELTAIAATVNVLAESVISLPSNEQTTYLETAKLLTQKARNAHVTAQYRYRTKRMKDIVYGVAPSLVKMQKSSPFTGDIAGTIELDAARNEMDAAQVMLFANASTLLQTTVRVDGDLKGDKGSIPASKLRLRRVGHVSLCHPVYKADYAEECPDPLMPLVPFDIAPNSFETVWVDVRVPVDTPAGVYQTTLTVTAMNSQSTKIPVKVRVRNFTIPARSSITSAFGLSPSWRVPQDRAAYLDNFLEHRITPYDSVQPPTLVSAALMDWRQAEQLTVSVKADRAGVLKVVLEQPGKPALVLPEKTVPAGQDCTFTFSGNDLPKACLLSVRMDVMHVSEAELQAELMRTDGTKRMMFERTKRQIQIADGWLQNWPSWRLESWQQPDIPAVVDWTTFDKAFAAALAKGITSHRAALKFPLAMWSAEYQKHLSEKGWLEYFYTYLYDEPEKKDYGIVNGRLSQVKLPPPGQLKNMMTARSFPPELPFVDIWCPELYSYNPELSRQEQAKGREVWWYVAFSTRHPYPNIWIDYPLLDCRIWPWMSWKHDIDGMLYWSVTHWSMNNPWETGEVYHDSNGDGSMLYPGNDGKPVDSMRWECLRDGMEDYEVFCLLEAAVRELGDRAPELTTEIKRLCTVSPDVLTSYCEYNPDYTYLLKHRAVMSDCLEKAVALLGHEPVIQGRPRRRQGVTQTEVKAALAAVKDVKTAPSTALQLAQLPVAQPQDHLKLYYRFDTSLPYVFDYAGKGAIGLPKSCQRVKGPQGQALKIGTKGYVELPGGRELLGSKPSEGTIEFMVKAGFDAHELVTPGQDRYACLFYVMETDGNGLPDGWDEIGIYLRNGYLCTRVGARKMLLGSVANPLKRDQWHHVQFSWKPGEASLKVNGKTVIYSTGTYEPPRLDSFASFLGAHPSSRNFSFNGEFDEVKVWDCWRP